MEIGVLRRWGARASWSLLDQGLFSGSHFVLNILLARWLLPEDYGAFAIAFSVFLILAGFLIALILEPMAVYGPSRFKDNLNAYFRTIGQGHVLISLAAGLALLPTIPFVESDVLRRILFMTAVATPMMLLVWLLRRAFYVIVAPAWAALFSLIYALVLIAGLFVTHQALLLDGSFAMLVMGGTSLIVGAAGFMCLLRLVPPVRGKMAAAGSLRGEVLRTHWSYGRWALGTAILFAFSSNIYVPLIGYFGGLGEAAGFRAVQMLLLPLGHALTAMGFLVLPAAASRYDTCDRRAYLRLSGRILGLFAFSAMIYLIFVIPAGPMLMDLAYGSGKFGHMVWLLPYLGTISFLSAVSAALAIILRAARLPSAIFWSQGAATVVIFTLGIYLGAKGGTYGLVQGIIVSQLVLVAVQSWLLFKAPLSNGTGNAAEP